MRSRISLMFAECSIVMLLVNGVLFLTPLSRFVAVRTVLVLSIAAMVGGFILLYRSNGYGSVLAAVALIAAGSGIAMPTITYSAASKAGRLGAAMGQLTAVGQPRPGDRLVRRRVDVRAAFCAHVPGWRALHVPCRVVAWIGIRGLPTALGAAERVDRQPP